MRRFWTITLAAVLGLWALSCATEPEPLDKTQPDALHKSMFEGEWYYKLTVVDTEWSNKATFIGEEAFFGSAKVRWEITEDKLNAYMVPQRYRDPDGNMVENTIGIETMVLSFPISRHFDIKYQENTTTREDLNVVVENDSDRPWWEREYIRVDFSENGVTNMWAPMSSDLLMGELIREPVSTWENFEFFDANDRLVDTRRWRPEADTEVTTINIDTKEQIRGGVDWWGDIYFGTAQPPTLVKWRHSLMKAKERDYEPMDYRDDFFRAFGFFRTEYEVYDEERAVQESGKRYFANRWNVADGRKIHWYLNPDFPDDPDLKLWMQEVADAWNGALQEALDRDDEIIIIHENEPRLDEDGFPIFNADGTQRYKYELGDMRYSFINYTSKPQDESPLGYGPSFADPDTGEIVSASVNVYGNWVDYVVTRAMDLYDLVAGNCTVEDVTAGRYFNEDSGKCDAGTTNGSLRSEMAGDPVAVLSTPLAQKRSAEALHFATPAMLSSYFPKMGVDAPIPARQHLRQQLDVAKPEIQAMFEAHRDQAWPLNLAPIQALAGTRYESMMIPHSTLGSAMPGARSVDDPRVMQALSPASRLTEFALAELKYNQYLASVQCRLEPDHYDPAVVAFVRENADKPRDWIKKEIRHWIVYNTTLHEMGHTLGLRHNFRGSMDRANFAPSYEDAWLDFWNKRKELDEQYMERIQQGDEVAYREYVEAARMMDNDRARYSTSSIMDYTGDWDSWQVDDAGKPTLPSHDRAAMLFGYGHKVEVLDADPADLVYQDTDPDSDSYGRMYYAEWPWKLVPYREGDLETFSWVDDDGDGIVDRKIDYRYDHTAPRPAPEGKAPRVVRHYQFNSDEKVFDDAFCTRFDRGVTATEIIRNFIQSQHHSYLFRNFKRDRVGFGGHAGYYWRKWLWTTYMMGKFIGEQALASMRYSDQRRDGGDAWGSIWDGLEDVIAGPEGRMMLGGHNPNGGEDLLRASMMAYNYFIYDVLMRPEYGCYQKAFDQSGKPYWDLFEDAYPDPENPKVCRANDPLDPERYPRMPLGVGWGWADTWDDQQDSSVYYFNQLSIGVELDKVIAREVMALPAALNDPLAHEKANGVSFWNSLWNNNGEALWRICHGIITENYHHAENPFCMSADGDITSQPVGLLEGFLNSGIMDDVTGFQGETRCPDGSLPVKPGMDALFAIYPIFWTIAGASHPWYHNALADRLEAQIVGGNHQFDVPEGAVVAEFTNPTGTKTWQAVQTHDNMSIAYDMVRQGSDIMDRINFLEDCEDDPQDETLEGGPGTHGRTCKEVNQGCFGNRRRDWCDQEGWDSILTLGAFKYRQVERIEALLIMMQDMVEIAGHQGWWSPGNELWNPR